MRWLLALGVLAVETDALALSCKEVALESRLAAVMEAEGGLVLAVGALELPHGAPDPLHVRVKPSGVHGSGLLKGMYTRGLFSGTLIGPGSRSEVKDLEVVTEIACYSRWCGSVPAVDAEHPAWLFVLKVSDPSVVYQGPPHSISFPPCTDSVFAPPPAAELDAFSAGWTR